MKGRFSAQDAAVYADTKNQVADFAAKIVWLLDNPDERKKMGEFGGRRVEKELAWEYSVPNLLVAYERAFSKRGSAGTRRLCATDEPMRIALILCTYNRCQLLVNTLESIAASVLPVSAEWEVLVVDNNSSDQTREVVEGFCQRYPNDSAMCSKVNRGSP